MDRLCLECNEPFEGRVDKKFCSDQCRNTYNNRLRGASTNLMRNINGILSRNRRILQALNPTGKTKVSKSKLVASGFNFHYFTQVYTTKGGNEYHFCYDQGYLELENGDYTLVVMQDYVHKDF